MSANQCASKNREEPLSDCNESSASSSISLIKLDELSSFGATKQSRLPALIKLNSSEQQAAARQQTVSMPAISMDQIEGRTEATCDKRLSSLPAQVQLTAEKENLEFSLNDATKADDGDEANISADYQVVDMVPGELIGPSLPPRSQLEQQPKTAEQLLQESQQRQILGAANQPFNVNQYPSHLGDSLIEMIINLKNENQNLVRALETNNEYVKERLSEFKRVQEEAKKRESQFALEKAEHEHQVRKLQRQNSVLSDRLKSMESKLKDLKLEVSESLNAAHSSKASSSNGDPNQQLYPTLADSESFANSALNQQQATTMQIDAASGELLNNEPQSASAPPMDATDERRRVANMTKEELSKRFDANKAQFYALDDPMKQCDELERQLNDIGKRDYEICLLQQQLNIYRQDYRLERMANLEAKLQIEKLKSDIDRLCFDRLQGETSAKLRLTSSDEDSSPTHHGLHGRNSRHRSSGSGVRFDAPAAAETIAKLGHHLGRRAAKSAAKAAKYAAKQAHREERAAAHAAAAAAAASQQPGGPSQTAGEHHHGRRHHRHHNPSAERPRGIRSEVVSDLLSTANKAMLTGYKMASTHVNLALDKLSAFEQAQAANLSSNATNTGNRQPSAPAGPPSID